MHVCVCLHVHACVHMCVCVCVFAHGYIHATEDGCMGVEERLFHEHKSSTTSTELCPFKGIPQSPSVSCHAKMTRQGVLENEMAMLLNTCTVADISLAIMHFQTIN